MLTDEPNRQRQGGNAFEDSDRTSQMAWREPPLREILAILKRRRSMLLGVVALTTIAATAAGLMWPVSYEAKALVMIEPREQRLIDMEQVVESWASDNLSIDLLTAAMQTQITVIEAETMIERAMEALHLLEPARLVAEHREAEAPRTITAFGYSVNLAVLHGWLTEIGLVNDVQASEGLEQPSVAELRANSVAATRRAVAVEHLPRSHVIAVSYTAHDPVQAAAFVNALVDAYIAQQREEKEEKTHRAHRWLSERAAELQADLRTAERRVRDYRATTGLSARADSIELEQQQLTDLTSQLIEARGASAALAARLERIEALRLEPNATDQLAEALTSPIITRLRQDRLDLMREYSQVSRDFGAKHPRILELRSQQRGIDARIATEITNAIDNLRGEMAVARGREAALQEAIAFAREETAASDRASIELDELIRQAEANRGLYQAFLNRAGEIAEQETLIETDARVIQAARAPTAPSSPSPLLFAIGGLVFSLAAGSVLVFLREQTDPRLRTGDQLQRAMRLPTLGMIPRRRRARGHWSAHDLAADDRSAFAEGVRGVCTQLQVTASARATDALDAGRRSISDPSRRGRVVLVTSALPEEGKTSLSIALALVGAPQLGRTLLVDCDLRRPNVARSLKMEPRTTPGSDRTSTFDLQGAIRVGDADVLVDAIPYGQPAAALASTQMEALIAKARHDYDWIILDGPPALGLPDALLLSRHADLALVVARWGRSKVGATRAAVARLRQVHAHDLCGVITDVAMKRHGRYHYGDEAEFYRSYQHYFKD